MKIPKKLRISGREFTIINDDIWGKHANNRLGSCMVAQQKIHISNTVPKETQEQTLIHEIFEAIIGVNDIEMEHGDLSVMSECLYAILKDNKLI